MDNNKKLIILLSLSIFIVIISTAAITYAYISVSDTQEEANVINTACFDTDFNDSNKVINDLGYPMTSTTAFNKTTPYTFTLTNRCDTNTTYEVILNVLSTTNIDLQYIRYSIDGTTTQKLTTPAESLPKEVVPENTKNSYILKVDSINGINVSKTDKVYLWIDDSAGNDIMGQKFEANITIYSKAG